MSTTIQPVDREQFREHGYLVAPKLLDPETVENLTRRLEARSGRSRADFAGKDAGAAASAGLTGWTVPDGVTRHEEFWDLLFQERLLESVRAILGTETKFLQHTDLHVGFSSFNWHRDSVARHYGVGPDWDESIDPYRIVRVGLYLQSAEDNGFRLGLIPGTHRIPRHDEAYARRRIERTAGTAGHLYRVLRGRNPEPPTAVWVSAAAGDAVIFDPRVIHTGTPVDGPKFSIFLAYGVPNRHFTNHWYYYRHLRPDLGYGDPAPALVERLREADLLAAVEPPGQAPEGAFIPNGRLNRLATRLRFS